MLKPLYLKIHGWLAVIFAIPLAVLCVTGAILALEPIFQHGSLDPGSLRADDIKALLTQHDPEGKARGLSLNSYERTLTIEGAGPSGSVEIDLDTRAPSAADEGGWYWSDIFRYNRRLHEHVTVAGLDITVASTVVMLVIILAGTLMGLPRLRNTVSGWHKGVAWLLLPLVALNVATGLFIAMGVSLNPGATQPPRTPALPLAQVIDAVAKEHDLSRLVWVRNRGGRQIVRLWDGAEARAFAANSQGLVPLPRNLSRGIHEGNILGAYSGAAMLVAALALTGLIGTGLWLFFGKQLRKFRNRRARAAYARGLPAE